jgi:hypothetical protein
MFVYENCRLGETCKHKAATTVVSLTANESLKTIKQAEQAGIAGAVIHDALLPGCARKIRARGIHTTSTLSSHRAVPRTPYRRALTTLC